MTYEEMIATENTNQRFDDWKDYRSFVTEHILEFIEDYYCKHKLVRQGGVRLLNYGIQDAIQELGRKPVVAIWGAGGCNDIDIKALSAYAELVLIDRNLAWAEEARKKAGLSEDICRCIDLKFWDIQSEDELDFDELLSSDIYSDTDVQKLLQDIGDCAASKKIPEKKLFDFSICFGLASQLNARFSGLTHIHNVNPFTHSAIITSLQNLNMLASKRLLDSMIALTKNSIITGNELLVGTENDKERFHFMAEKLTQDAEEHIIHQSYTFLQENSSASEVEGSRQLLQHIKLAVEHNLLRPVHCLGTLWNFMPDKLYLMELQTLDIL